MTIRKTSAQALLGQKIRACQVRINECRVLDHENPSDENTDRLQKAIKARKAYMKMYSKAPSLPKVKEPGHYEGMRRIERGEYRRPYQCPLTKDKALSCHALAKGCAVHDETDGNVYCLASVSSGIQAPDDGTVWEDSDGRLRLGRKGVTQLGSRDPRFHIDAVHGSMFTGWERHTVSFSNMEPKAFIDMVYAYDLIDEHGGLVEAIHAMRTAIEADVEEPQWDDIPELEDPEDDVVVPDFHGMGMSVKSPALGTIVSVMEATVVDIERLSLDGVNVPRPVIEKIMGGDPVAVVLLRAHMDDVPTKDIIRVGRLSSRNKLRDGFKTKPGVLPLQEQLDYRPWCDQYQVFERIRKAECKQKTPIRFPIQHPIYEDAVRQPLPDRKSVRMVGGTTRIVRERRGYLLSGIERKVKLTRTGKRVIAQVRFENRRFNPDAKRKARRNQGV